MAPFIPTKLYNASGNYVTTVELPPFLKPVQVILWGSRIFVFAPLAPATPNEGQYLEADGMCVAWTEEEKKNLGIH